MVIGQPANSETHEIICYMVCDTTISPNCEAKVLVWFQKNPSEFKQVDYLAVPINDQEDVDVQAENKEFNLKDRKKDDIFFFHVKIYNRSKKPVRFEAEEQIMALSPLSIT